MATVRINPQEVSTQTLHSCLLDLVAPRPIAFASTVDIAGNINLSPFSFFNVFGANPPILIFSPARRIRDNTVKHTLENMLATDEVVINIGTYEIVEQMSLASTEYAQGINEFIKAGLTAEPSELVKPPRVKEAAAAFECKLIEIKSMGESGGAGNLIICEIMLLHVQAQLINADGHIDPANLTPVARLGKDWYSRIIPECLFKLPKPNNQLGIGFDQLPYFVINNTIFSKNNLARLANIEKLPEANEVISFQATPLVQYILAKYKPNPIRLKAELQLLAKKMLELNKVTEAWKILLIAENNYSPSA